MSTHRHTHPVSPVMGGLRFDTAKRKKAAANIFEDVRQDVLLRLFQRAGDLHAAERVSSIFSHGNHPDPDLIRHALKALPSDKKDRFTLITGLRTLSLRLR